MLYKKNQMRKEFLKVGHTFSTDCSDHMRKLIATLTALALGVSLLLASGGVGYAQDDDKTADTLVLLDQMVAINAYLSGDYAIASRHYFRYRPCL